MRKVRKYTILVLFRYWSFNGDFSALNVSHLTEKGCVGFIGEF